MSTAEAPQAPSLSAQARSRAPLPWWAWLVAAVAILSTAAIGVLLAPAGTNVAVWWPAAGISVLFALLLPRHRLPHVLALVLVVTLLANLLGGRDALISSAFAIANALEVLIVLVILRPRGHEFVLSSLRAGLRFAVAVLAGALAVGVAAAAGVALIEGGDFLPTVLFVGASHAAAVAMIAPLAVLPTPVPPVAGRIEIATQTLLLGGVIVLVFQAGATLPLTFVLFPVLAWAALRFPMRFVLLETLVAAVLMLLLTLDDGGPFRREGLHLVAGAAVFELLLLTYAGFAVVLSAAQYELRALTTQLHASNRLLTGSVVDARIGLVIADRGRDTTTVRWANRAGSAMLAAELHGDRWHGPLRTAAMTALRTGEQTSLTTDDGRTVTIAANTVQGDANRITVQLLDVTALLVARKTQIEAEVERDAARTIRAELERQRDDFLATTSHELRTPITSIVGYAELLSQASGLSETERDWLTVIDRNAYRLSDLVEDLLSLSRGDAAPPVRPEPVPVAALFDEVVTNLRPTIEQREQTVVREATPLHVFASRADVGRMLSNLVVNACKFTPAGGTVRLSADAVDGAVRIHVTDSGRGMSQTELDHAFEPFYRAPGAERDSIAGTGLGLAIVADLARRNGGRVALRAGEAGGLVATLTLPHAVAP